MRTLKLFALVGIFLLSIPTQPANAHRLEQSLDEFQNYVVIGAFKYYRNASRFASHANRDLSLKAKFEMNPNRNLYYVYVLSTNDRTEAITEAKRLRSEGELSETWVYSGALGKAALAVDGQKVSRGVDINPVTDQKLETVETPDHQEQTTTPETSVATPAATETKADTKESSTSVASSIASAALDDGKSGKAYFFKLYRAVDNNPVEGDVDAIDVDRTRKIGSYKGNVDVKVGDPASKSDNVSFVCEVFGYRKAQIDVNYNNPEGEGIEKNEQGATVVPFELIRLQKGDIAVMYNVFFFKDAAIMRPESRYEVNSLLEMLNENPKYKIRIHGHTNGGAPGKIISMAKDSKSFFSLNETQEGYGSAKKLSEERGKIIYNYLVSSGMDPKRMQVKAWGGKRPIHDKLSTRASENVRVEIEILEN